MRRILVGLDSSERASAVLAQAVALAKAMGAKLVVMRAVGLPPELPIEALAVTPDALPALLLDGTQKGLNHSVAGLPGELLERAEARIGTPWQVLCDAAKEYSVDLLVVGTHGYKMLDRLLGTTAARVVNHAPCSVFVVREAPSATPAATK